eukprot:12595389-Alexandrium_andersonii.AAC.1
MCIRDRLRGAPDAQRFWNPRWTTGCSGASRSRARGRHSSRPNASPASSGLVILSRSAMVRWTAE